MGPQTAYFTCRLAPSECDIMAKAAGIIWFWQTYKATNLQKCPLHFSLIVRNSSGHSMPYHLEKIAN